jgi:hypothetical protein
MNKNVLELRLVKSKADETVKTFLYLAELARRGELQGSAVCVKTMRGEQVYFTDCYRANTSMAAGAAMRMSMRLMHELDPPL